MEKFGRPVIETVCLGGIVPSENMKAFLRLPLKFRMFSKPKEEEHLVQAEARGARSRMIIRDKAARGPETFEEYRLRKEQQEDARQPLQDKKVDFTNVRATDVPSNKFINMPGPAPERLEIQIQSDKLDALKGWELFVSEECDQKGNPKGSINLSREDFLGRKEILEGVKNKGWVVYGTGKTCP